VAGDLQEYRKGNQRIFFNVLPIFMSGNHE
jgi:hypothetical protein